MNLHLHIHSLEKLLQKREREREKKDRRKEDRKEERKKEGKKEEIGLSYENLFNLKHSHLQQFPLRISASKGKQTE